MTLRYVALGDSYTIGTALTSPSERWPDRLVAALGGHPPALELVANLGVEGFTSADVIAVELPRLVGLRPDLVSLLVGVNDVVQGVPEAVYRTNVERILDGVLIGLASDRVVAISTPDYTVTPRGGDYGERASRSAAIRATNAILRDAAAARGIAWVDIHDLSLRAADDPSLVAEDGLHPSGAQYALWLQRIVPAVARLVRGGTTKSSTPTR